MKNPFRTHASSLRHPSDEVLVGLLDGELGPRRYREIEAHLAVCWNCRRRREKMERAIGDFVDYMEKDCPSPPRAWRSFERGLAERPRPAQSGSSMFWRWMALSAGTFKYAAAGLAVAAVGLWFWLTPRSVSASEFLENGRAAEASAWQPAGGRIVYQKLRLQRFSKAKGQSAGAVEIWRDPKGSRPRLAAEQALWSEVERILQINGMDPKRPLSPAGYERWRSRLARRTEKVSPESLPDGASGLALDTTSAGTASPDSIVGARLVVRSRDWHPVRQDLRVQGAGEVLNYELTEVAFDLRSPSETLLAATRPPAPIAPPPPVRPAPGPNPAAIEVEALYALHRLGACLGEPVQVVRDASGRVAVQGLAETAPRKQQLIAALEKIQGLKLEIRTPEEYAAQAPPARVEPSPGSPAPARSVLPIQDQLTEYYRANVPAAEVPARIAVLTTQGVEISDRFLAEAWGLRRLSEAYPPERLAALDAAHRRLLEEMMREHASALREEVGRASSLLEPVLAGIAGSPAPTAAGFADACGILESAQTAERLTRGLLAGANDMSEPPEHAARQLLTTLRAMQAHSAAFESALRKGLSADLCQCRTLAKR